MKPLRFFALVFALSIPFWLLGSATTFQLLPGLPLSALMIVCPLAAAVILAYREGGSVAAGALLRRILDCRRITSKGWYAAILLLMPAIMLVTFAVMRAIGSPLPEPRFPAFAAVAMFAAFFLAAIGEEVGWSGYAIDPLQERWGALQAAILLGLVGVAWHLIPLLQAHRPPGWIVGWSLNAVAIRVLTVWIYNNTGRSLFAAILFHDIVNLSTYLFPNYASHWDPRICGPITAVAAAIVTLVWGPRTLSRRKGSWRT